MKIAISKSFSTKIRLLTTLFFFTMAQVSPVKCQTITVSVKAERPLDIKRVEVTVTLTETKLDYDLPESPYKGMPQMPDLMSAQEFISEIERKQLEIKTIDISTKSKKQYSVYTKKEQEEITTKYQYLIILNSNEDLSKLMDILSKSSNAKIISTDYSSKNEEKTLQELTDTLLKEARISADRMGKMINKRTTNLSNLKVINMQTQGHPKQPMLYVLEQKAYVELEVTYETKNL